MEALEKSTSCQEEQFIEEFVSHCESMDKASYYLALEANETTIGQSSSSSSAIIGEEELNEDFKPDENFFDLLYSTESPKQSSGPGVSSSSNSNELDSNAEVDHLLLNECASDDSKTEHPEPEPELELEPESDNQVVEEHSPTQPSIEDNGRTP